MSSSEPNEVRPLGGLMSEINAAMRDLHAVHSEHFLSTVQCKTCGDTGWVCSGTKIPADFANGTCCRPWESEEFDLGNSCPSADGCPDCHRAMEER